MVNRLQKEMGYADLNTLGIIEILKGGQDNDFDMGVFFRNEAAQFQPIHIGHFNIGENNVRGLLL